MMRYSTKANRAKVQLHTWLNAVGVPCTDIPGALAVEVLTKGGKRKVLSIDVPNEPSIPGDIVVKFNDIRAKNLEDAKKYFGKLIHRLGYKPVTPVDRGVDNNDDDFELFTFRHKELRRSPNPPPAFFEEYKGVVRRCVNNFYYPNQKFCLRIGLDRDDLMSYAWLYATIFEANFKVLDPTQNDNQRLLTTHLNQRLGALQKRFIARAETLCANTENIDDIKLTFDEIALTRNEVVEEPPLAAQEAKDALYLTIEGMPKSLAIIRLNRALDVLTCNKARKIAQRMLNKLTK